MKQKSAINVKQDIILSNSAQLQNTEMSEKKDTILDARYKEVEEPVELENYRNDTVNVDSKLKEGNDLIVNNEDNTANSVGTLQASNWNHSQATSGRMIQVTQSVVKNSSHMYLKRPQAMGSNIKIRTKGGKSP